MADSILDIAKRRFAAAEEAEREIRAEALEDLRFVAGEQWDERTRRERDRSGRPALTFNRLPTFVQQVSNEARNNKPSIKFSPVDSGADVDTAEVFEGLARHIQYASKADVAYETAIEYSSGCSIGAFRMLADYVSEDSFDQELRFAPIVDPFSVYGIYIPAAFGREPEHAFVVEDLSEDEYHAQYPGSRLASLSWGDAAKLNDWMTAKRVRVAEYWYTEPKRRTLQMLADGSRKYSDEPGESYAPVVSERSVISKAVKFCKTNGYEILPDTETEWLGRRIPIFAVLGRVVIIEGRPQIFSLVRFMKDPQRLINFYKSGIAEAVALGNRAPYIGYKGQFKDGKWRDANTRNYPYLEAEPTMINGALAPLPQRQQFEPAIQALSVASAQEVDDLKSIAGIFDSSLGSEGNEKSGVAIMRRQQQSSITNLHFVDNLKRAQEDAGKELGYAIPRYYDTPREVRILGEDETDKLVRVNQAAIDPKSGKPTNYLLDAGRYDVTVSIGPAYTTKRQEAFDMLTQMAQANPQVLQFGGDIIFKNSDIPGADQLAERWKKTLPPGLADDEEQQAQQPYSPAFKQQVLDPLMQQHEMLTQQVDTLGEEIRTKRFEMESRERIAAMQEETKRSIALAQIDAQNSVALLQAEVAAAKHKADMAHQADMAAGAQDHAMSMKGMDQEHSMQMQQQQQQAEAQALEPAEPAEE